MFIKLIFLGNTFYCLSFNAIGILYMWLRNALYVVNVCFLLNLKLIKIFFVVALLFLIRTFFSYVNEDSSRNG